MDEIWKDIVGYEGLYRISDKGDVYSIEKKKLMKQWLSYGYPRVGLTKNGKQKFYNIHRLVYLSFVGPAPEHIDHINHDKTDNRVENLRAVNQTLNEVNKKKRQPHKASSIYKGVTYSPKNGSKPYVAMLKYNGKISHYKSFENEIEAAMAYNTWAKELYGDYAYLNVIPEQALAILVKHEGGRDE